MSNPIPLHIDIKSETINKALDLIAQAGYVLYEPTRIKRKAQAESDALIIKTQSEIAVARLQMQAGHRLLKLETVRQGNINNLTNEALQIVQQSGKSIDPATESDWIRKYFGFSQDVSNEDMQQIWAKVLAGEFIKAGTFSYKTMSVLANMRKDDAELFSKLCSFTILVGIQKTVALIFNDNNKTGYSENAFDFEQLQLLDSLGLIHFNDLGNFKLTSTSSNRLNFLCGEEQYSLITEEDPLDLPVGNVMMTREGQELFHVVKASTSPILIKIVNKHWVINGRSLVKIV